MLEKKMMIRAKLLISFFTLGLFFFLFCFFLLLFCNYCLHLDLLQNKNGAVST